ncbi:MAG: hypothetical protein JNK82_31910 [Myxococcaceae bacterium]|nr:hypothetical protein [Myxococcaceae bacterium]
MSSNTITGNRAAIIPTREQITSTVEHISNHGVTTAIGDHATTIADLADKFDTGAAAAARLAKSKLARPIVSAGGALLEKLRPGTFDSLTEGVRKVAERVGINPNVVKGASTTLEKTVKMAGVAAIGYDAIRSFTDTKADMGSKLAQAGAAVAVGALTFTGVGTAIVAVDVVTGGGVTGGAKGLVALADAALTGDRDALNSWVESAKSGDQGWLLKAAANNKTIANVATKGAEAVINAGAKAREAISGAVSRGWNALFG